MAGHVESEDRGGVRILRLSGSVANALTPDLRAALLAALGAVAHAPSVRAVVLAGSRGTFSAGLNVTEHDSAAPARAMVDVIMALNDCPVPVVAALEGAALGAGLAIALAAHARVASKGTRVAVPDLQLHLVPSAGVTQLVPRLGGAALALDLIFRARSHLAGDAAVAALFDQVVAGDPLPSALALAEDLATRGARNAEARREGFADPAGFAATFGAMHQPEEMVSARGGTVQAIEASLVLPLAQGLELELLAYEEARTSRVSRIARHMMVIESRVARPAKPSGAPLREIILTGPRGPFAEVCVMALDAGWRVHLALEQAAQQEAIRQSVTQVYDGALARGLMTAEARADRLARLLPGAGQRSSELSGAQMIFEMRGRGVADLPDLPRVRVSEGDGVHPGLGPAAVWLRIYEPAHVARLCEIAAGPQAGDTADRLRAAMMAAGKTVLRAAPSPGMIGRNLDWALWGAAVALVEAGHNPYSVDAGAAQLGFARGPFQQMDAAGLKAALGRLEHLGTARGAAPPAPGGLLHRLIAQGQTGQRAGQGVYRYGGAAPGRRKELDSGQDAPDAVAAALRAALVNEAARLLHMRVAGRAGDVDIALITAQGLPRRQGGLLWQADETGLPAMLMEMQRWRDLAPDIWTPGAGLQAMVRDGVGFYNRGGRG